MAQRCVVLGDVVDSQAVQDREAFQETLEAELSRLNAAHESSLHAPLSILKGIDEFGGVLTDVGPAFAVQRALARAAHPEEVRVAVVLGAVDVNVESETVAEMDGPAFARADEVLSELADQELTFRLVGTRPRFDAVLSDEINLIDLIRGGWSERQLEIIEQYDAVGNQTRVAESLGISPQAVSKAIRNAKGHRVLDIQARLAEVFAAYPELEAVDQ